MIQGLHGVQSVDAVGLGTFAYSDLSRSCRVTPQSGPRFAQLLLLFASPVRHLGTKLRFGGFRTFVLPRERYKALSKNMP